MIHEPEPHIRTVYRRQKYRTVTEMKPGTFGMGTIDISPHALGAPDEYYVNRVFVPVKLRGDGMGTRLMARMAKEADEDQITLYIDPTANYGSDVPRLTKFFERFGFVWVDDPKAREEKGSMCRKPNTPTPAHS